MTEREKTPGYELRKFVASSALKAAGGAGRGGLTEVVARRISTVHMRQGGKQSRREECEVDSYDARDDVVEH